MLNLHNNIFETTDPRPSTELGQFLAEKGEVNLADVHTFHAQKAVKDGEKVSNILRELSSPETAPVTNFPFRARLSLAVRNLSRDTYRATSSAQQIAEDIFMNDVMPLLEPMYLSPEGHGGQEGYVSQSCQKGLEYWAIASAIDPHIDPDHMLAQYMDKHIFGSDREDEMLGHIDDMFGLLTRFRSNVSE